MKYDAQHPTLFFLLYRKVSDIKGAAPAPLFWTASPRATTTVNVDSIMSIVTLITVHGMVTLKKEDEFFKFKKKDTDKESLSLHRLTPRWSIREAYHAVGCLPSSPYVIKDDSPEASIETMTLLLREQVNVL